MVGEALALVWGARRGLAEGEVRELLGRGGTPLPRALWSPLYLAIEDSLVSRSGLLGFFHEYLRQAVYQRYLGSPEAGASLHLRLAEYFRARELDDRQVDELPWQLAEARAWQGLKDCVTDLPMFLRLMTDAKQYELMGYWLAMATRYDMVQAYTASLESYEQREPSPQALSDSLDRVAQFLALNGQYAGAEPLLRRALAIQEKTLGPEHPETATSLNNLAYLLESTGDYAAAEPLCRRALAVREQVLGPEHPDSATSCSDLAGLLADKGDYAAAEPLCRRALAISERVLGPEHPDTALSYEHLAVLLADNGDYATAEPLLRRALAVREQVLGPEHPQTATILNNLAEMLRATGNFAEAESLCRRSLAIREKVLGPEHPRTAVTLNNLAALLRDEGDYPESAHLYRRILSTGERILARSDSLVPSIMQVMANSHNELAFHTHVPAEEWAEAEAHYQGASDLFARLDMPIEVANVGLNLQTLYQLSGRPVDAPRVRELTKILEQAGDRRAEKGHKLLKALSGIPDQGEE